MRGANDAMVTINAAATAIAAAENRTAQYSSVQKRRWGSCWSLSSCFGSQKQSKKIGHAVLVPEPSSSRTEAPMMENLSQPPSIVLPFIAPPSSPASFLQSEPPSATHSPGGVLSFTSASGGMYSPGGPANMFAIGPYAHETQLVSPPVFSTYTTEPSTAPFTPPPESVHLTTPSSPEVPFARLLGQNGEVGEKFPPSHYEFQSYQLYPGSPTGQLVSPCEWESLQGSGTLTPDAIGSESHDGRQGSGVRLLANGGRIDEQHLIDHRVSFEVTPEQVVRCVERRRSADVANSRECRVDDVANGHEHCEISGDTNGDGVQRHQKHRSTMTSVKEFNFDNADGAESNWWAGEKVIGKENGPIKNWSFFPMMQPGVS